jgi:putative peptidoglycan lipid II flippase
VQADVKAWNALKIAFIPAALGAGILQVNFLISRSLAFNVDVSGLTYYYIANRIVELPIGLFSTSIATVIFPAMATAYAQNDLESLGRNFSRGMRLVLAINLAAAVGFIVFSGKIIKLLFEFGRFTAIDCERTEIILLLFALAMPFHALISIVTRALNVMGKTRETFRVAMISVAANIVLSMIAVSTGFGFHGWTGVKGLALANAFAAILQFVLLRRALRQTSDLFFRESLVLPTCQTLVGSLLMGALAYQSFQILFGVNQVWLGTKMNLLISLTIAAGIGAVFYAIVLYGWKYPERDMFQPFVQRVRRLF